MEHSTAEGTRLADKRSLLLDNHGELVPAPNISKAFDDTWTMESASQILITV